MSVGNVATRIVGQGTATHPSKGRPKITGFHGPPVGKGQKRNNHSGGGPSEGMISFWNLTETGNRADSHGTNTATDINTVLTRTGPGGLLTAADFSGTSERLDVASPHGCGFDSIASIAMCGWFQFDISNINHYMLHNGTDYNTANQLEWQLRRNASSTTTEFRMGSTLAGKSAVVGPTVANATWAFIYAYFDADTDTMGISVNDSVPVTSAVVGIRPSLATTIRFGFAQPSYYQNGGAASVGIWNAPLDPAVVTSLYNSGTRLLYEEL